MGTLSIDICWLAHGMGLPPPKFQTAGAAGVDLAAAIPEGKITRIEPGARLLVPTGFCMALPAGYEAQIRPRSGLALKHGVTTLNAPGTIDADYRGEISVLLINLGEKVYCVQRGDRIAQMIVAPVCQATFKNTDTLETTERGTKGYGSTGYGST
jgi:dUTP pyrophosphatase